MRKITPGKASRLARDSEIIYRHIRGEGAASLSVRFGMHIRTIRKILATGNIDPRAGQSEPKVRVQPVTKSKPSPVNPSHYVSHKITPIDLIKEYDLNFDLGNVIKYVARHKEKDGRADLCKALWYLLDELGLPREEISVLTERLRELPSGGSK